MIRETFGAAMLLFGAAAGAQATEVSIKTSTAAQAA